MKKLYLIILLTILPPTMESQIINFPDPGFKEALLTTSGQGYSTFDIDGNNFNVDVNGDSEIDVDEALAVYNISFPPTFTVTDLTGIEFFSNLKVFSTNSIGITNFNMQLPNLEIFDCAYCALTSVDFSGCPNLVTIECGSNQISSIVLPP